MSARDALRAKLRARLSGKRAAEPAPAELAAEIAEDRLAEAVRAVEEAPPKKAAAKRKRGAPDKRAKDVTLVPPVPTRSERTAGGALKPQGVVFRALYDCSYSLCNVIAALDKFYHTLPLTFTERGLEIAALDSVHVMFGRIRVPRDAFVAYDNLTEAAIEVHVSAKALQRVASMSRKTASISFMYDQYGNADESLHLMLYPRTEANAADQCMRTSFKPADVEADHLEPDSAYQYRVFVPGRQFCDNVRHLAGDASIISLVLSADAFELAAVSEEAVSTTAFTMSAAQLTHEPDAPRAEADVLFEADARTAANGCLIERLPDADPAVSMAQLRGYKISSSYLSRAARFAMVGDCQRVAISLGVQPNDCTASGYSEVPLHLRFEMRSEESGARFDVELWIAPKLNEDV